MRAYQIDNLIAVGGALLIILVATMIILRVWQRVFEARHELQRQLLEKMPPEELTRLLETRSISSIIGGDENRPVEAMGRGATLLSVGIALGVAAKISSLPTVGYAAIAAMAAGIGQFVAAWLIARELSRNRT